MVSPVTYMAGILRALAPRFKVCGIGSGLNERLKHG